MLYTHENSEVFNILVICLKKYKSSLSYGLTHTLENHCTQPAQSLRIGCSQRGHKIAYLAVTKGIFCQYFTSENILR